MKIDITGRRAIVAGGSRGIGRAIALAFAEAGAAVSICARGAERLAATREEIDRYGRVAHSAVCDLSDAAAIPRYIEEAAAALGGIDILINNASGFGGSDDEAGWAASISVDLLATVRATRAALPFLEKSDAGTIVNISSISGFRASVRTPPYGAVKAAILEYTLTQAAAFARKGIRVTASPPARSNFPAGPGTAPRPTIRTFTAAFSEASRSGAWAVRRRWRRSRFSCARRSPAGSPARTSRSMAGRCSRSIEYVLV
jgi:3-oxoacyl-[acyl-carrier protein] reductase